MSTKPHAHEPTVSLSLATLCKARALIAIVGFFRDGKKYKAYCTSVQSAVSFAMRFDEMLATSVYFNLNPLRDDFDPEHTDTEMLGHQLFKNTDIARHELMFIDADPTRIVDGKVVTGICATDDEKSKAYPAITSARDMLAGAGFEEPHRSDSGNGYGLYYSLASDVEHEDVVDVVGLLSRKCSTDGAKIDTSVTSLKQLARLPGTVNRKGEHSAERPWRLSKFKVAGAK